VVESPSGRRRLGAVLIAIGTDAAAKLGATESVSPREK